MSFLFFVLFCFVFRSKAFNPVTQTPLSRHQATAEPQLSFSFSFFFLLLEKPFGGLEGKGEKARSLCRSAGPKLHKATDQRRRSARGEEGQTRDRRGGQDRETLAVEERWARSKMLSRNSVMELGEGSTRTLSRKAVLGLSFIERTMLSIRSRV